MLIVLFGCDLEEEVAWAAVCRTPGVPKRSRPLLTHPLGGRQTARVVRSCKQRQQADEHRLPRRLRALLNAMQWVRGGSQRPFGTGPLTSEPMSLSPSCQDPQSQHCASCRKMRLRTAPHDLADPS